jgi:RNA polymerase sigma factor (sigma-70 family)
MDRPDSWESTLTLLTRARAGDPHALSDLFARYVPDLRRWARGRLPPGARDLADTHDLVQDALLQTFRRIDGFDCRGEGALQAYLRQAVMNRIRDEIRRTTRRPAGAPLDEEAPSAGASPFEAAVGAETADRYERALSRLDDAERQLIVARVELQMTYGEVATATGRPSADAARMAVARALVRLAESMREPPGDA